jgi:site-specific DNA recombinase
MPIGDLGDRVKRVALYLRVSSGRQQKLDTIKSQRTALERFAQGMNWEVVAVYEDNGVTGTTLERPELDRMLAAARSGQFEAVLVWSQDRLGRASIEDMLMWLGSFKMLRIPLIEASTMADLTSSAGMDKLNYVLKAHMNEQERLSIVERTSRGKREKIREGRFGGGVVAFGYVVDPVTKRLVRDPGVASDVACLAFSLLGSDGLSA